MTSQVRVCKKIKSSSWPRDSHSSNARYQSRQSVGGNEKFVDKCQKMKALLTFFLVEIFLVPNFHLILPQSLSHSHMLFLW